METKMSNEANLVAELQNMGARILRYVPSIQIAYQIDSALDEKAKSKVRTYGWGAIRATGNIYEVDLLFHQPRYEIPQ
jgi:hypothetical protein